MSSFVVVRLDPLDPDGRERVASEVVNWLLASAILAPLHDSLWPGRDPALGDFGPGVRWTDAVQRPLPDAWLDSPGEDVGVELSRQIHSALENYEDFACAHCGTALPDGTLSNLIDRWWADVEPVAVCGRCGNAALLGDWPSPGPPALVGAPAIEFHRWPPLRLDFVTDLSGRLGDRCRAFAVHS